MSSTDDRIVRMQFDNAQFKKGAAETQKSLADLNKAVDSSGKSKGLLNMNSQMGAVSVTASKMAIVTTTALATITNKVVNTGLAMAKALTFEPIQQGFGEYESLLTKQNVIMNATGKSAQEVKGYLNELNEYSDQTIYSFGNMTDSITKFVNAGVPLPKAVVSIKGIANAAAFAGASTQEANRAMYAFSQSMQTGYIMLQDWMQIENANMGTIQFKETLLEAAVAAGTLTRQGKGYVTANGTFVSATKGWRDGLQEQWATVEVLNSALGKYADRNTELGRKAFQSATEVRTFTAFMDTLKESLGSGWSQIFTALIGNLKEATTFWSGLSNTVSSGVEAFFKWTTAALTTWRQMGGFEKTIQGIKNILAPFAALVDAVGTAFRTAFPSSGSGSGKALYALSAGFELITRPLQWLADLIRGTTPVLTVFFQAFRIGGTIIGRIAEKIGEFVGDLLGLADLKPPGSGGFLGFIKDIGKAIADAVDEIDDLLQKGASLSEAFGAVNIDLPSIPGLPSLPSLSGILGGGGDSGGDEATSKVEQLSVGVQNLTSDVMGLNKASDNTGKSAAFNPEKTETMVGAMAAYGNQIKEVAKSTVDSGNDVETVGDKLGGVFGWLKDTIGSFIDGFSMEKLMSAFNMGLLATMVITVTRFFTNLNKAFSSVVNIGDGIGDVLGGAGSALESFQTAAKAQLILNIAIALGILAAALLILSFIPADKLKTGLAALTGAVASMGAILFIFSKTMEKLDVDKMGRRMIALGIAMVALATSLLILSLAFIVMSKTDWDGIVKGLLTMSVLLGGLTVFAKYAQASAGQLLGASVAIMAVATSMLILAAALLAFKLVDWGSMAKAGVALAGVALAVGLLALIPYAGIAQTGLALLAASVGMLAIANALILFGLVKWSSIAKGIVMLGALAAMLAVLMVVGNPVTIAGIVSLSFAMIGLATAALILNAVDWSSIAKIGVVMLILVVGLTALLAVLTIFAPAVLILALFAAVLLALGIALASFSAALAIALALAAGGAAAFAALATGAAVAIAVFLQTLAQEAPVIKDAILTILQNIIDTIVAAVPMIIDGIKRLWDAVKKEFTSPDKKKATGDAGKSWMEKIQDAIKKYTPILAEKAKNAVIALIRGLISKADDIAAAAVELMTSLLRGVASKIDDMIRAGADLLIAFMKGMGKQTARVADAGVKVVIKLINDMADSLEENTADLVDAFYNLGTAIIEGLAKGITDKLGDAVDAVKDVGGKVVGAAKNVLKVFSPSRIFRDIGRFLTIGLALGIQDRAAMAITAVARMTTGTIAMADSLVNAYIQKLDQRAIAARAKAIGLARAAQKAIKAAEKTKGKDDDKSARRLAKQAEKADKEADKAERRVKAEQEAERRRERWKNADAAERAKIRAADAQRQIQAAKAAEQDAAAALVEANALEKRAKAEGLTAKQRKEFRKEARRLRKEAEEDAKRANKLLENSRKNAEQALIWQKKAGEEAAKSFQEQFDAEAKADADAEAFEKLSAAEKAKRRREEAATLQATAEENLKKAKELAYTDIKAANELAELALDQAERARDLIDQAEQFEEQSGGGGQVVDLQPTEAAAIAFNQYKDLYDSAMAAAAATPTVEFNQYNTSPESLSPSEIYRQTHNLVNYAADKLQPTAA